MGCKAGLAYVVLKIMEMLFIPFLKWSVRLADIFLMTVRTCKAVYSAFSYCCWGHELPGLGANGVIDFVTILNCVSLNSLVIALVSTLTTSLSSTGKWLKSFQQESGQVHLNRKAVKSTSTGKWL
jgi:hypothetical protein